MKISEIKFRDDLYPRFKPSQETIQKYSENVEVLPPILVNQNNILIDGFHRWKAHEINGLTEIKSEVVETKSEAELKQMAYKTNSHHGLQLSNKEKRHFAIEMIELIPVEEIAETISASVRTVRGWTSDKRKDLEERRNELILEKYLHGNETKISVAESFGVDDKTIGNIIRKNGETAKIPKDPFLYNIWNTTKGNETEHFGSFPLVFMENLLHYHTEPMDLVFDPFAGYGTTIDACKNLTRRFYCSDLEVKPGRENDVNFHDISTGLPDDLQKPTLVFLDPPYWKQAKGKYTAHENQFGDMDSLEVFNNMMQNLFSEIKKRKIQKIAIVISPTQWPNDNHDYVDHTGDFKIMLSKLKYHVEMEYSLPYSTQQYNGTQVKIAKEQKICMALDRKLTVYSL